MAQRLSYEMPSFEWSNGRALIEMRQINKVFHSAAGAFTVLKGVDVDIYQGEFASVVGRSGSGKSTLVNMITGIDHPTSGTIRVADTVLNNMPEGKMSVWRGRNLGIVFQFFQLLPMLTLIENVMLPMDFCNMYPPAEREDRAMRLLQRVGLADLAHKLPAAVSGGQQQSAAVARALANDPPILIADEPTGNLDSRTAEEVLLLFEELVGQGKTILMVTHDSSLAQRTTRTLLISDGELVNDQVVRAFPTLPHERLLNLTHLARPHRFAPGEIVLPAGEEGTIVFIVSNGVLEAFQNGSARSLDAIQARFDPGQFIDPFALRREKGSRLGLRAAQEGPLELLVLDRESALTAVGGSDSGHWRMADPANVEPEIRKGWLSRLRRSR